MQLDPRRRHLRIRPATTGQSSEPTGWTPKGTGLVTGFLAWGSVGAFAFLSRPGLYNDPSAYSPAHLPLLWMVPLIGAAVAGVADYALFGISRDAIKVALYTVFYPLWLVLMTLVIRGRQREWARFRRTNLEEPPVPED